MKKKILLHFKSDKFLRVFYFSQFRKNLEKNFDLTYLMNSESKFNNILKKKQVLIYQKGFQFKFFFEYPLKLTLYFLFKILDFILCKNINFESVTYRYNLINKLGYQHLQSKFKNIQFDIKKEHLAGNFLNPILGFPFAKNKFLLNAFKSIYFCNFNIHPGFYDLLKKNKFSGIVYFHLQSWDVFFIKKIAKLFNINQINIIYGWDQPGLKGYVAAKKDEKIVVTNEQLKIDLVKYHKFHKKNIINLGNFYLESLLKKRKKKKLKKLSIFYALNTIRGAKNEIETINHIVSFFTDKKIKFKLVLRPHPHDRFYLKEITKIKNKNIEIMKSTFFDINDLIKKLNSSDFVLTNGTSMYLDARSLKKQCAFLIMDKSDLNLRKFHLRFFMKKKHNLIYNNIEKIYKDYESGLLEKKNNLLDEYYISPLNKNITNNYISLIESKINNYL